MIEFQKYNFDRKKVRIMHISLNMYNVQNQGQLNNILLQQTNIVQTK